MWLLPNVLLTGSYPKRETGYGEAPDTQHSLNTNPPFENFSDLYIELDVRYEKTGTAGKLLIKQILLKEDYLEQESRDALNYMCGFKRKNRSFSGWKSDREYKQKVRNFSKINSNNLLTVSNNSAILSK
jgi:hypothetical protein